MVAITPRQIRGARAMMGWSMLDLARAAGVSVSTVKRVEESVPKPVPPATADLIREALEGVGVCFLDDDGRGEGLRCGAK